VPPFPTLLPDAGPVFTPAAIAPGGGTGGVGGAFAATISTVEGFCLALNQPTLTENPAWTRIDDPAGPWHVQGYTIDRGRTYEFDRTSTGVASVSMVDTNGDWDPTNSASDYGRLLLPMTPAALALQNPVTGIWSTIYRGFISDVTFSLHPTEKYLMIRIDLVDGMDVVANAELMPGGSFGDTVPAFSEGDVYYRELTTPMDLNAAQTRIRQVLTDIGWPLGLSEIFTGNVKLFGQVYPPRQSALAVIQDAADAEFPAVANVFVSKDGKFVFHGRHARFNPTEPQYHIASWLAGDETAVTADPTTTIPLHPPLEFAIDKEHLYNAAFATYKDVADADIAAQYVVDTVSAAAYGTRTWSAENLLTAGGLGTTAAVETLKFAQYVIDNYATPRIRANQMTFKAARPTGDAAATTWALACGVDISDVIVFNTTHDGRFGFQDATYFVEGIHYDVKPMTGTNPEVTLILDVSPYTWYGTRIG
jgi:hypothetical protein